MKRSGFVTLVGAGPGDPGLITVAGREALRRADVVLFDRLVGEGILALVPDAAERVDVGKHKGHHPVPQEEINRLLLEYARLGKRVVRLKGGDPYLFGRGAEELEELVRHGIPFRVVPGVTSAVAAPAYAGIPVTHRNHSSSLHIITGHGKGGREPDIPYRELATLGGTLVFLMGVGTLADICGGLLRAGMAADTPAALVENGTRSNQRRLVATLADIEPRARDEGIASPAVLVVGGVCTLADTFDWTAHLSLWGRRILAASSRATAGRLAALLREKGGRVDEYAAINLVPNEQPPEFWDELDDYSWLVFTSPFGVETFFAQLKEHWLDVRAIAHANFAAVGRRTTETLASFGFIADFVPSVFSSRGLGDGLAGMVSPGENVLLFRARDGSDELPAILREHGIAYKEVAAYETVRNPLSPAVAEAVREGLYDAVTFTSASSVEAFADCLRPEETANLRALCIGDMTGAAAAARGMRVEVSPVADLDGMLHFILERWEK